MSTSKYEVSSLTVEELLSTGSTQFSIPSFQRSYSWGGDEISQLIDDVYGNETQPSDLPYFLGAIVLASKEAGNKDDPLSVLDGQQRLTTLSLVVAVLIYFLKESGDENAAEHQSYLFSKRIRGKRTPKVLLQKGDEQRAFETLLSSPEQWHEFRHTTVGAAVGKIFECIKDRVDAFGETLVEAYANMLQRLMYDVEIVKIKTPSERDAFRLFETLNDRGLALSAADLIKNKLFSHCEDEIEDALDAWSEMTELTKEDDVVNFLRTYWIATQGFVRKANLYDEYKSFIVKLDKTKAASFAIDLKNAAVLYKNIIKPDLKSCPWGAEVAEVLERINSSYKAKTCRPALLACAKFHKNSMLQLAKMCETITVRYSVVGGKNPNLLEIIYEKISNALRNSNQPWAEIVNLPDLKEIPSDGEFVEKISFIEVPSPVNSAWRQILVMLNSESSSGETKIETTKKVHVEHILPQNPKAITLEEAEVTQEEADSLIHRIGNLTLLSSKMNQNISNKPFSEKKTVLKQSEIRMTRELAESERWGAAEIDTRSRKMASSASTIFPHPYDLASNA